MALGHSGFVVRCLRATKIHQIKQQCDRSSKKNEGCPWQRYRDILWESAADRFGIVHHDHFGSTMARSEREERGDPTGSVSAQWVPLVRQDGESEPSVRR